MKKIAQTVLKKSKVGGLILLNFKTYFEATVIKTVWHWHKIDVIYVYICVWGGGGEVCVWSRSKCPEANLYIYDELIVDKDAKTTQSGKNNFFKT
jgi:hypothetical protein